MSNTQMLFKSDLLCSPSIVPYILEDSHLLGASVSRKGATTSNADMVAFMLFPISV